MHAITFLNIKGGVGKTTTAVNIAVSFAHQHKKKVLLIDYDPQGNATSMFSDKISGSAELTSADVMRRPECILEAALNMGGGLSLIPSSLSLSRAETDLQTQQKGNQIDRLKTAFAYANGYDYIIVDCAPALNLLNFNAVLATDLLIVPIKPEKFALEGFKLIIDNLIKVKEMTGLEYKILFTIVSSRSSEEKELIDYIRDSPEGKNCFKSQIRSQPSPVAKASSRNKFVVENRLVPVGADFRALAEEILGGE
jgi:chromosome partitioning protein